MKVVIEAMGEGSFRISTESAVATHRSLYFPNVIQARQQAQLWSRQLDCEVEDRTRGPL